MVKKELKKSPKNKAIFLSVLIVLVLSFCITIGTVLAWLETKEESDNAGNAVVGSVDFEIYNGNSKITTDKSTYNGVVSAEESEVSISSGTINRSINVTIRNTGTVAAIIRATIHIYYKDASGNPIYVTIVDKPQNSLTDNEILVQNDNWVNDFKDNASVGYSYYNDIVEPYSIRTLDPTTQNVITQDLTANAVSVISQISVPTSKSGTVYYLSFTIDGVAHPGNIYSEQTKEHKDIPVEAYPFGVPEGLPDEWTAWEE